MIIKINGNTLPASPVDFVHKPVGNFGIVQKIRTDMVLYSTGLIPLITAYMGLSKYLTVGVIMFAGTAWMFGHRTKAIELVIGAAAGFLLILNAWDVVQFLEGLKGR